MSVGFRRWLFSELKAIAAPPDAAPYALDMSTERVTLVHRSPFGVRDIMTAIYGAPDFDETIEAMRKRVMGVISRTARVDLLLPAQLTAAQPASFPAEARADLRDAVYWRLETIVRQPPETLCFDAAILAEDPTTGFLRLQVAAAPAETVQEAIGFAQNWGFEPQRVSTLRPIEGFPYGPIFLRPNRVGAQIRNLRRMAGAIAILALVFTTIGAARMVFERRDLAQEAVEKRREAEAVLSEALQIRKDTLRLASSAARPVQERAARPLSADWLNTLAQTLPPSATLHRVEIGDKTLRIEGSARNADAVLSALDVAPEFFAPRHSAAVMADPQTQLQRFSIEASLAAQPEGANAPEGREQ